jgi:hypothetical protein
MVDYEAEYDIDYVDWEVFDRIESAGGVRFPQDVHQFVVASDKSTPFGILSAH